MFKYAMKDGELTRTEIKSSKTVADMIDRKYSSVVTYRGYSGWRSNKARHLENSIFVRGLGTKNFAPSSSTKWDCTRKCFVWTHNGNPFSPYDASNVHLTIRGYYLSDFDISTLPDAKNKKANKKRYALVNRYCEDSLADCKMWDNRAMEKAEFDYSKEERLAEYRAWWAIRHLLTRAFKDGKRISCATLTEMFIRTDYSSPYHTMLYAFGDCMRRFGEELIEYLTAETEKVGKSGGGRPGSDEADQN